MGPTAGSLMVNASAPGFRAYFESPCQSAPNVLLGIVERREDERLFSMISLLLEYEREADPDEKLNIERTLIEILRNEALENT